MPGSHSPRAQVELLAVALVIACASSLHAASVAPMDLATLADHAGQVIVGRVVSVESSWASDPRRIESTVVFEDVEYLKGAGAGPSFRLTLPGGQIGSMQMRVCCAPNFAVGQKWLLFLLPTYKTFPVVGVYRGAFRVDTDSAGYERVFSADRYPVTGIDSDGFVQVVGSRRAGHAASVTESRRMRVPPRSPSASGAESAETAEAFIARLRPVLASSKDYHLTEPAGRRVPVVYTATTLKRAPADSATDSRAEPAPAALRGAEAPPAELDTDDRNREGSR